MLLSIQKEFYKTSIIRHVMRLFLKMSREGYKVKEKDYDYSLTYLREKIIFHPFHDENDKRLTKFVKNQKKKDRKKELEQLGDDIGVLSDLMKKTCHVTSNNKNEGKKEKPYLSGIPCYSYINDLLPSQR